MDKDDKKLKLIEKTEKQDLKEEKQIPVSKPAVMKKMFKLMHFNLLKGNAEYKSFSNFKPEDLR